LDTLNTLIEYIDWTGNKHISQLQAQYAMREHDLDAAAQLLEECLLEHNPDDWAGFMLLMACKLPRAALPFDDAAQGIVEMQCGFSKLVDTFRSKAFWEVHAASDNQKGLQEMKAFIDKVIGQVCPLRKSGVQCTKL
jgi:hypothetical protein